ncbi:MAG: hypothetical protein Q8P40_08710 [Nitrospirota bacterium]|nr:hypothetical protein [Nitrospirota bacterium]
MMVLQGIVWIKKHKNPLPLPSREGNNRRLSQEILKNKNDVKLII